MSVTMPDRQAEPAGGFLVHPETVRKHQEALLVLSDGSVWKGRSDLLSGLDLTSLKSHLSSLPAAGEGATLRGCITAAGATTPLHAAVALAVAQGEIGRP